MNPGESLGKGAAAGAQPGLAWQKRQYVRPLLSENNPNSPPRCNSWNGSSDLNGRLDPGRSGAAAPSPDPAGR